MIAPLNRLARWFLRLFRSANRALPIVKRPQRRVPLGVDLLLEDRIVPSGNPPVAVADLLVVHQGHTLTALPLINDSDAENDPITPEIVTNGSHGVGSFDSLGNFSYTPSAGFVGTDEVSYRIFDGEQYSDPALLQIDVTNAAPITTDDAAVVLEGQSITIDVLANDSDSDGDSLTPAIDFDGPLGTASFDSAGLLHFQSKVGFTGSLALTYRVHDGAAYSGFATILIEVNPTPEESAYLAAVALADQAYLVALDGADETRDISEELNDGEYYGDVDEAYAVYEAAVATAEIAYDTAHAAADASYQSAIAAAQAALDTLNEEAQNDYTAALDNAEADWDEAVQAATAVYDLVVLEANSAYQADVAPLQAARAAAQIFADENPEDSEAQAALAQAEQALVDAEAQAAAVRDAAIAAALVVYDVAQVDADAAYEAASDVALTALNTELDDAQQEFDTAGQSAWDAYQPVEDAAVAAFNQAEQAAWDTYQAAVGILDAERLVDATAAESDFDAAEDTIATAWNDAEQTAWTAYFDALTSQSITPKLNARDAGAPEWEDDNYSDELPENQDFEESEAPPWEEEWDNTPIEEEEYYVDFEVPTWFDSTENPDPPEEPSEPPQILVDPENWRLPSSLYFARNVEEAKYRAWLASECPAGSTLIGKPVARAFFVSEEMTWADFFHSPEIGDLEARRTADANALDPALISAMDAEFLRQGESGQLPNVLSGIGEQIATRWRSVPGFAWVAAETSWQEFYTPQANFRLGVLRGTSISATLDQVGVNAAAQVDALIARLRYSSFQEITGFVTQLQRGEGRFDFVAQQMTERMIQYTSVLNGNATDEAKAQARESLAICQSLYSEIHARGDASKYGVHDSNLRTFGDIVSAFRNWPAGEAPLLRWTNYRGTLEQRAALLADTSFEVYAARERLAIDLRFGPSPRDATERDAELANIMRAEYFYRNRERVMWNLRRWNGGLRYERPTDHVIGLMYGSPYPAERERRRGGINLYNHYIRGAYDNGPGYEGTGLLAPHETAREAEFFTTDRYYLVTMGASLLTGWNAATGGDQLFVADNLHPTERSALVNSLYAVELEMTRAGAASLARAAQSMREFIVGKFNLQMQSVAGHAVMGQIFNWMVQPGSGQYVRTGLSQMSDTERLAYNAMPISVRRYAEAAATAEFYRWRERNPFRVRYQPAFGHEYVDRFIINSAEMLSPVFRHGQRHLLRSTDEWGDLEAIRSIMSGNYNVTLGPTELSYSPLAMVGDNILTGLTIIPIGRISGVRHLVMFTSGGVSASLAMSYVEMAPISEQWRGPLRFLAGLAGGIGGSTLGNAGLNLFRSRMPLLVARSRELAAARSRLAEVDAQVAAFQRANPTVAVPIELARQRLAATMRIVGLEEQVAQLRTLGGQALIDAENTHRLAMERLATEEARLNAPGLAASQRSALRRGEVFANAQRAVKLATQALDEAYRVVDQAMVNAGLLRSGAVSDSHLLTHSSVSNWAHTADIETIAGGLEDLLRVFRAHRGSGAAFRIHPDAFKAIRDRLAEAGNQNLLQLLDQLVEVTPDLRLPSGMHGAVNYSQMTIEIGATGRVGTLYEELTHFRDLMIFESRGFVPRLGALGFSKEHRTMAQLLQNQYPHLWGTTVTETDAAIIRRLFEDLAQLQMLRYFIK